MLGALANAREPALVARTLDLTIDAKLRTNERLLPLWTLLSAQATRDDAWAWIERTFDKLAPLLPDRHAARVFGMYSACDPRRTDAVKSFFAPRADKLTGGPRNLALALESAGQCAARVAAHRDAIATYILRGR
jgi:hypothetical protein